MIENIDPWVKFKEDFHEMLIENPSLLYDWAKEYMPPLVISNFITEVREETGKRTSRFNNNPTLSVAHEAGNAFWTVSNKYKK